MTARLIGLAMLLIAGVSVPAQQGRDVGAVPVGTGEISGVVLSPDATPQPVRRVVISVSGGELPAPRSAITDDDGRFTIARLPAGTFAVVGRKAAYLAAEFGASKPGRAGTRIALAAGERKAITLTIHRGAVIAGVLQDDTGAPVPGATIQALPRSVLTSFQARGAGSTLSAPAPAETTTDDRGAYRLYGLMPGEYVVGAVVAVPGAGEIGLRQAAEIDAILSGLTQRQNRSLSTQPIPPPPPAMLVNFAPIYFPGTSLYADATRVRVGTGEERGDVNITFSRVRVSSLEGRVAGNVPNLAAVQLAIIPDTPRVGQPSTGGITTQPPNAEGDFSFGNLAPGRYRIVARARAGGEPVPSAVPGTSTSVSGRGGLGGGAPPAGVNMAPAGDLLYAVADVDVRGQDLQGVNLTLQPGGTASGRIVFDALAAAVPDDLTAFRVAFYQSGGSYISNAGTTRVGNALSSVGATAVMDDGTFMVTGLGPDTYYVTCLVPQALTSTWKIRSAIVDGRDLLDTMVEGPAVNLRNVVITLSDKRTSVSGTLQSASGQPVSEYFVVAFSPDRAHWRLGSRRTVSTRPATDGRFVFDDLPEGEYLLAALTDLDPADLGDAAFLEHIALAAVKVTLKEGERLRQDLRIK